MYLKVYKEDVIEGLQNAAGIITQRTGAAYLRSIWLKAERDVLELLSTDSNIEFRGEYTAEVLESGLVGVQGKSFVELLRKLPDGQISLKLDAAAQVLHIEQGRRKYKLPVNDATWFQNFSVFPEEGAIPWAGETVQNIIDKISFCIGDEDMEAVACLILNPATDGTIEAAGMNGHQFAMMRFTHEALRAILPEGGILLQKKYLGELKKWLRPGGIELNLGEKRLFIRSTETKECMSVPLSAYTYPDYQSFLARLQGDGVSTLTLTRKETQEALVRIAIFNSDSNRCTYFDLSSTEAVLSVAAQDTGSATESLDVRYNGDLSKIAFPTTNLLAILDRYISDSLTLIFTGSEGPCGVKGEKDEDYLVILMPMKIVEDVNYSEEQV